MRRKQREHPAGEPLLPTTRERRRRDRRWDEGVRSKQRSGGSRKRASQAALGSSEEKRIPQPNALPAPAALLRARGGQNDQCPLASGIQPVRPRRRASSRPHARRRSGPVPTAILLCVLKQTRPAPRFHSRSYRLLHRRLLYLTTGDSAHFYLRSLVLPFFGGQRHILLSSLFIPIRPPPHHFSWFN